MTNLPLVDLLGQYKKIEEEIDRAVLDVIKSGAYINGPEVKAFAADLENYLGTGTHVIPVANGTDALQIALMALGLEPGDEVITPSFTYIATAEVIALLNLKAVFVDVDPRTFTIDVDEVEKAITPRTKAIVPVHLYGHCAQMELLKGISAKHGIPLVEDTAQAIGSYVHMGDGSSMRAGTIGDIGTTSFFPSKNLGCYGDGGAMFTRDEELAQKIRMIANHGQSKRYYHDLIGCNSRLDSIQAAILRIKLRHLDEYTAARNSAAEYYSAAFAEFDEIETPFIADWSTHGFHQYTIKLHGVDRAAMQAYLQERGIPTNIYYPVPVHRQKGFAGKFEQVGDLKVTDELTEQVLSLPIHTELNEETLAYITNHIKGFLQA